MVLFKRLLTVITLIVLISFIYLADNPDIIQPVPLNSLTISNITRSDIAENEASIISNNVKTELLSTPDELNQTNSALKKLIDGCDDAKFYEDMEKQFNTQQAGYLAALEKSNNADDKLALFMQSDLGNEKSKFEYIFAIESSGLNKKLHYEQQLFLCNRNFDAKYCNDELYRQANTIDKDNAYLWHLIAAIDFRQGKIEKALTAISIANSKAYYNEYHFEMIQFIEQSYQNNSNLNFSDRLVSGIGVTAAKWAPGWAPISQFCLDNQNDINIADLCLHMAIQLEKSSKTRISSMIGLGIQEAHYKHNGQTELLKQVEYKRKKYEEIFSKSIDHQTLSPLMMMDENIGRTWLNSGLIAGESFAYHQAMKELLLLSQDENYRPCEQYSRKTN